MQDNIMTERKKAPRFTTPRVSLKFPKLHAPDYGTKEYPKPLGEYSTRAVMKADDPVTQRFIATLQPMYEEAMDWAAEEFKKLKVEIRKQKGSVQQNPLFSTLYDKETEEPTGEIEFKFSMPASGIRNKGKADESTWTAKPSIFDARGNPLSKVPEMWSGTIGKVNFEVGLNKDGLPGYFIPGTAAAGLKLKLKGVQIIELRTGGSRNASDFGFEEEEGYEADTFGDSESLSGPASGLASDEDF